MNNKNEIKFELKEVNENQIMEIDGISFSNIVYILIFVDEVNLFTLDFFQDSFVVFKELKNSILKSDKYLLFTGVSGIADDAGWEYVDVFHDATSVVWNIRRDNAFVNYTFDRKRYFNEISKIVKRIESINSIFILEPLHVVYPE